jgi:hypothetical protein
MTRPPSPDRPASPAPRQPSRRRLALGVAGFAAAALVAGGVVVGGPIADRITDHLQALPHGPGPGPSGLTTAELADWTAAPAHPAVTSAAVQRAAAACLTSLGITSPAGTAAGISNVDQRGAVITLRATAAGSRERGFCLAGPQGVVLAQLVDTPGMPLPAIGAGAVNVQTEDSHGSGADAISLAYGQAGAGVTGLVLTTAAGEKITATVQNGIWALWEPPKDASTGDLGGGTVTWTTAGGGRHTAPVTSLYAS